MSKIQKEIERLKSVPKDYTYQEAKSLFAKLEFYEDNKGRTSGPRVRFRNSDYVKITMHKPHPSNILKQYQIIEIIRSLEEGGII